MCSPTVVSPPEIQNSILWTFHAIKRQKESTMRLNKCLAKLLNFCLIPLVVALRIHQRTENRRVEITFHECLHYMFITENSNDAKELLCTWHKGKYINSSLEFEEKTTPQCWNTNFNLAWTQNRPQALTGKALKWPICKGDRPNALSAQAPRTGAKERLIVTKHNLDLMNVTNYS